MVTPMMFMPLLCKWAYLFRPVVIVVLRVHILVRLMIIFLLSSIYRTFQTMNSVSTDEAPKQVPAWALHDFSIYKPSMKHIQQRSLCQVFRGNQQLWQYPIMFQGLWYLTDSNSKRGTEFLAFGFLVSGRAIIDR